MSASIGAVGAREVQMEEAAQQPESVVRVRVRVRVKGRGWR